jgi:4-hydroxybenzoate polyprenyltransferase
MFGLPRHRGGNYIYPVKKLLITLFDAVFITRPILLIPVWGYFFLGHYRAALQYGSQNLSTIRVFGYPFKFLAGFAGEGAALALVMCSLSVCGTYVLNQLVDLEADKKNAGLPLLAKAGVSLKMAGFENVLLSLVPLVYGFLMGGNMLVLFLLAFFLTIAYNVRPLRFTGKPFLDFLSNASAYGLLCFGLGWVTANGGEFKSVQAFFIQAAPYFLYMMAGSINSTIPDIEGDQQAGKTTTVVLLGARKANLISVAAVIAALAASFSNADLIAIVTGIVSVPFFLRYAWTGDLKDGFRTFQVGGGFLMVITVAVFPWFALYGIITYAATRLYFSARHGIVYPKPGVLAE